MNERASGSRLARNAMAFVLAGGRGSRLMELTDRRAKPAVYFGGKTRIIDFALSNALNSGHPPDRRRHPVQGAQPDPPPAARLELLPARAQRELRHPAGEPARLRDASGTRAPPTRSTRTSTSSRATAPEHMVILAGDHVYKMDYELMLAQHVERGRRRHRRLPRGAAHGGHGLRRHACRRARPDRLASWRSPQDPPAHPRQPGHGAGQHGHLRLRHRASCSTSCAATPPTRTRRRDFGKDMIPYLVQHGKAVAHRFPRSCVRSDREQEPYWRDVGTVDAYWEANIDLTDIVPALDLYDQDWPIWTYAEITAAGQVRPRRGRPARHGGELAGVGRLHRLGRLAAPLAAVHRRPGQFLRRARRAPWSCPMSRSAAGRG